jgi:hypothetical protein
MRSDRLTQVHQKAPAGVSKAVGTAALEESAGNGAKTAITAITKDVSAFASAAGDQRKRKFSALSTSMALLGSLRLPVHSAAALGKEVVSVIRHLVTIDRPDRPDSEYGHMAAFVLHAMQQEQLALRAVATGTAPLGLESEDGVVAGAFTTLMGYLLRVVAALERSGGNSSGSSSGGRRKPSTAVSACIRCLVGMVERACAHSAKQPATAPPDPASVPPVLLALERQRVPLLQAVHTLSKALVARGAAGPDDVEAEEVAGTAVEMLGRLLALPWMTVAAAPAVPPASSAMQPHWVLTLRSRPAGTASSSSGSSGVARRRVALPCLDIDSDAAFATTALAAGLPPRAARQRLAGTALRALLEDVSQHLVDILKVRPQVPSVQTSCR